MKQKTVLTAMVIALVCGFVLAGCSNPAGDPVTPPVLYTVIFDANEGDGDARVTLVSGQAVGDAMPADPSKTAGDTVFQGWYTEDGNPGWGEGFRSYTPVTANLTVYARWGTAAPKQVSFDINGAASGTPGGAPVVSGEAAGPLPPDPVRAGADFGGWYTKDGSGGDWGTSFTETTSVTADITVHAQWKCTVTFNAHGGTVTPPSVNVIESQAVNSLPTPSRAGFVFGGWFTKNGSGGDWGTSFTGTTTVTEHITVHAQWKCTVTFNAHGGTVTPSSVDVIEGQAVSTLPTPSQTEFAFIGWYTKDGSGGDWGASFTGTTTVTEHITVHAQWTRNRLKIALESADYGRTAHVTVYQNGTTQGQTASAPVIAKYNGAVASGTYLLLTDGGGQPWDARNGTYAVYVFFDGSPYYYSQSTTFTGTDIDITPARADFPYGVISGGPVLVNEQVYVTTTQFDPDEEVTPHKQSIQRYSHTIAIPW